MINDFDCLKVYREEIFVPCNALVYVESLCSPCVSCMQILYSVISTKQVITKLGI